MVFWASFWPEFAATLLSIVIGIPVGLWVERRIESRRAENAPPAGERTCTAPEIGPNKQDTTQAVVVPIQGPTSLVFRTQLDVLATWESGNSSWQTTAWSWAPDWEVAFLFT